MEDSCYDNEEDEGVVSPGLLAGVARVNYSRIDDDERGINDRRIDNGDGLEDAARAGPVAGSQQIPLLIGILVRILGRGRRRRRRRRRRGWGQQRGAAPAAAAAREGTEGHEDNGGSPDSLGQGHNKYPLRCNSVRCRRLLPSRPPTPSLLI